MTEVGIVLHVISWCELLNKLQFTGLDLEMEIEDSYLEVRDMIEGVMLYIFRGLKEKRAEEIELVRAVYPSEEFLLPEPGKELRLTFAGKQLSILFVMSPAWA
jgi:aspartyl/asparaginyl-tRNA synthetase